MSNRSINLTDRLYDYLHANSLREPQVLAELRAETAAMPEHGMQISPEQGQFMGLLLRLMAARRVIEVGTFTGYSSLCIAGAMPAEGRLTCCDVSEEFTAIARRYWARAGLDGRIDLKLAPAVETLDRLAASEAGRFDLAFIDADKGNYLAYYERVLKLLRPGGLVLIDNVLWNGAVADPGDNDSDTVAIRLLNEHVRGDKRVSLSLVPIGDGLTMARKR